jgi:hypothetical protein
LLYLPVLVSVAVNVNVFGELTMMLGSMTVPPDSLATTLARSKTQLPGSFGCPDMITSLLSMK